MDNQCSCCCCAKNGLSLPDKSTCIYPNNIILLERFSTIKWKVGFGWFSYEGNRKIYGWYLTNVDDPKMIKPIQDTDLYDVYVVQV